MLAPAEDLLGKSDILQQLQDLIQTRLPSASAAQVLTFVQALYRHASAEDLRGRNPEDLYIAIISHWELMTQRTASEPDVRIYSPLGENETRQTLHSVVEIVTADMPFLVDSIRMALNRHGLTVHLILHCVISVRRSGDGQLQELNAKTQEALDEAVVYIEVDRHSDPKFFENLQQDLLHVLADVSVAVSDWPLMRSKLHEILQELESNPPPIDAQELAEGKAYLKWIEDHHFTFLGYRQSELVKVNGSYTLRALPDTALGIAKNTPVEAVDQIFSAIPEDLRHQFGEKELLVLTKTNTRATVHRPTYMDYVGIKRLDNSGNVIGEHRFLGLYTSAAYNRNLRDIPLLRRRLQNVFNQARLAPHSHNGKAFLNIIETYPRDELFQIREQDLLDNALDILQLQERQRVRLYVRREIFGRFVSCIVYVPRERFDTEVRECITQILINTFHGKSADYSVHLSESVLARLYFTIHSLRGSNFDYNRPDLEKRINECTLTWADGLKTTLLDFYGEEIGIKNFMHYSRAFPAAYRDDFTPAAAVRDIVDIERLPDSDKMTLALYRPANTTAGLFRFKIFSSGSAFALSDILPILENMGVRVIRERPYEIKPATSQGLWIYDFTLSHAEKQEFSLEKIKDTFQQTFENVWRGTAENDGFNRLVLRAQLSCREIIVLRAYCKYLRQTGVTFSQAYMEQVVSDNPEMTCKLIELFHARFALDQEEHTNIHSSRLTAELHEALESVASLDEDRILRSFFNVILATMRTNYYQTDSRGKHKPYLSFKFDPSLMPELPLPRPKHEIFVYSPKVEGIHLRGGDVSRGGLRWSDRREDYRTEILGLMKAQMVKNSIIVPVGAKGGFVVKQLIDSSDRNIVMQEVTSCYQTFIRGMLDLTDNIIDGKVIKPQALRHYDNDDPYLVVAADKGTASFSDAANSVAKEYNFWLGDAFASGGSSGYDHKKMGITARGAWESVKRHFRGIGKDIQNESFTAIGIGDMSGDVFGNGMLLSRHIKLVAAFDHRHIFLDPNPDCIASYKERQRLFQLPRSSWADYDMSLLSEGGGIYPRSAKSIRLSSQVRQALQIQSEALTPDALIRVILKAPVDLFWNGGIGTYIKAKEESHLDVGDRTNDAVRINAEHLRCHVVGEGGNLGFTQKGRIEYALNGGRINTDFIDNAGGVSCSDYEVNIKILLNMAIESGLMTEEQRNHLLVKMTDEVAEMVLQENYWQTWAITSMERQATILSHQHQRFIRGMERAGKIDRELEKLPDDETFQQRKANNQGLTRPELAVLVAYAKNDSYQQLLDSDATEDPYPERELLRYFPVPLRERFRDLAQQHRLRRELIATFVTNRMVNRLGAAFVFLMQEEQGAPIAQIVRAYLSTWEIFSLRGLSTAIAALDNKITADLQSDMLLTGKRLVQKGTLWLLRNPTQSIDINETTKRYFPGVQALSDMLPQVLNDEQMLRLSQDATPLQEAGVPEDVANRVARLTTLYSALDIIEISLANGRSIDDVAAVYFALETRLEIHWLRGQIAMLPANDRWQTRARNALDDDLYIQQRLITISLLNSDGEVGSPEHMLDAWDQRHHTMVTRYSQLISDLKNAPTIDITMLSVALREIQVLHAALS